MNDYDIYYKTFKARKNRKLNELADSYKPIIEEQKMKAPIDPLIDWAEKNDLRTDISRDTLLVAKQFMVFAHLRCPKPPVRVAKGLLQSTIRCENTSYLGMDSVNVYVGNAQAFYMPFTNEEWHSAKAYPMDKQGKRRYAEY